MPLKDKEARNAYERERVKTKYKRLNIRFPVEMSADIDRRAAECGKAPATYVLDLILDDIWLWT